MVRVVGKRVAVVRVVIKRGRLLSLREVMRLSLVKEGWEEQAQLMMDTMAKIPQSARSLQLAVAVRVVLTLGEQGGRAKTEDQEAVQGHTKAVRLVQRV